MKHSQINIRESQKELKIYRKHNHGILVLISIIFLLLSCDHEAQLSYIIKNETSGHIKVIFTNLKAVIHTDTLIIQKNEQETIAINGQGINGIDYYVETGEKLRDFSQIDIFLDDTIKSVTDCLKTSLWEYNETGKHSANYILTVDNEDF